MPGDAAAAVSIDPDSSGFGLLTVGKDLTSVSGPAITYFGEAQALTRFYHTSDSTREFDLFFNGIAATSGTNSLGSGSFSSGVISGIADGTGVPDQWINTALSSGTLGTNTYHIKADDTDADDWFYVAGTEIVTPIHTSSHYQTFETPFLHELVGGDRNMEQTNLVVTADGKTWDEVTRDTSYIGDTVLSLASTSTDYATTTVTIMDECRGITLGLSHYWKDSWAMGYDRLICMKTGEYRIEMPMLAGPVGDAGSIKVNGTIVITMNALASLRQQTTLAFSHYFNRGDYVQSFGGYWSTAEYNHFRIYKERN
jgi:hypothetical protein